MSLTIPQAFDEKHKAQENVRVYFPAARMNSLARQNPVIVGRTEETPRVRNYANEKNVVGALGAYEKDVISADYPYTMALDGTSSPAPQGEALELLNLTSLKKLFFVVSGVYKSAGGLYARLGAESPASGQGNIIVDDTNITVTTNDANTIVTAHGGSWLAGERYLIGLDLQVSSPLLYKHIGASDTVSRGFASGSFGQDNSITIADEIEIGETGSPSSITALLACNFSWVMGDASESQGQYENWRKGNFLLIEKFNQE